MDTTAITAANAAAVYKACAAVMSGDDKRALDQYGFAAKSLGDVWRIQSVAYKRMSRGQKAQDAMSVNAELMRKQATWSRNNERQRMAAGARRLSGGMLSPDGARALDALYSSGYAPTRTGCIARALIEAAVRGV